MQIRAVLSDLRFPQKAYSGLLLSHLFQRQHELGALLLNYVSPTSEVIGRYALTSAAEATSRGSYTATLSIRSGHGQSTHDRVFRFVPDFATAAAAIRYACREGRRLLQQPGLPA